MSFQTTRGVGRWKVSICLVGDIFVHSVGGRAVGKEGISAQGV